MFIHGQDFETGTGRAKIIAYLHKLEAEIHDLKTETARLSEKIRQIEESEKH